MPALSVGRGAQGIVCVLLVILLAGSARAEVASLPLGQAAYITGEIRGRSCGRLLVKVRIPDDILNSRIDLAILLLPNPGLPDSIPLVTLEVRRLTTDWQTGSVSWTHPWRSPGGDWDTLTWARHLLVAGDGPGAAIDLSKFIREWQRVAASSGIMLKRTDAEGGGFRSEGALLRRAIQSARLKVWYSHVQR